MENKQQTTQVKDHYKIEPYVVFSTGNGNLVKCTLTLDSGTSCELYLHGAHVTSFKKENGEEILFMSPRSNFAADKPIRGGIPVIFPQFGPGKLKQHGFARDSEEWVVVDTGITKSDSQKQSCWIKLALHTSETTLKMWPHHFLFEVTIRIDYNPKSGSELYQELNVTNLNKDESFDFTTALHTYFSINSINDITIQNLENISYFDKVTQTSHVQSSSSVKITSETDSIYYKTPQEITIKEGDRVIHLKKNFSDVVVWNIWEDKCKTIADLGPDNWKNYICAESGAINPVTLKPSESWKAFHTISKSH